MTKLEQLIQDLCPNGVKMVRLGDAFKRLKGTPITAGTMKQIADDAGDVTIVAGGKTIVKAFEKDIPNANIIRVPAVLVQSRGVIDFLYYDTPFTFKNEMWAYTTDSQISVKYLYYVLQNDVEHFRDAAKGMGSLPQISLPVTENFEIPLPPLAVQSEIVRLLDKFTLYKSELAAELAARCKQYEHYRNQLLTFDENTKRVKLGEVCEVYTGGEPPKDTIKGDEKDEKHPYPVWGNGKDIYGYSASYRIDKDATVISSIGANTGAVFYREAFFTPIIRLKVVVPKIENLLSKFLYYYLSTVSFEVKSSSVPNMNSNEVKNISIPLPPLEVQERIVAILDRFDALCNDIKIGLPAEIELRQKQYEHYRDKLLTF